MDKNLASFYVDGRRKVTMYDGISNGIFCATAFSVLYDYLNINYDIVEIYFVALVFSFCTSLLFCSYREKCIYEMRTKVPKREKYLGELFLDEYSDEQLFEDIKNDKELQKEMQKRKQK